jgi:hypothetical protein
MKNQTPRSSTILNSWTLISLLTIWAIVPIFIYLFVSSTLIEQEPPKWYQIYSYISEMGAFLAAAWLCLRNWRTPLAVSGRSVWLCFGLGALSYFIGDFFFGYWELALEREPDISLGDFFFTGFYLLFIWGMLLVVLSRRIILEIWQWLLIAGVAAFAIWLAVLVSEEPEEPQTLLPPPPAIVAQNSVVSPLAPLAVTIPYLAQSTAATPGDEKEAPAWVMAVENLLVPLSEPIVRFYAVCDVLLLVMSATLILSFWGGQFSRTWLLVALSALTFYMADISFAYISVRTNYESGGLTDFFWIFSGTLLAIAAILEYDTSTNSR